MNEYKIIKDDNSFHADRLKGIGAKDIATLVGYTKNMIREIEGKKYQLTPYVLWLEKTGRIPGFGGNEFCKWGNLLEPVIIQNFMDEHGLTEGQVRRKTSFIHPDYRFARCHPDLVYFFGGEAFNQEIKSGSFYAKRGDDVDYGYDLDDTSSNGIPAAVYCQVQWQLFCTGIETGGVSALINTSMYREYGPIQINKKAVESLLALADKFWWHVKNEREPKPETWGDVQLIFPEVRKTSTMISGESEEKVRAFKERKKEIEEKVKKLELEKDDMKKAVGLLLGENNLLTGADGEVLAKQSCYKSSTLSAKNLEKENPWLHARVKKYVKEFDVRRLTW